MRCQHFVCLTTPWVQVDKQALERQRLEHAERELREAEDARAAADWQLWLDAQVAALQQAGEERRREANKQLEAFQRRQQVFGCGFVHIHVFRRWALVSGWVGGGVGGWEFGGSCMRFAGCGRTHQHSHAARFPHPTIAIIITRKPSHLSNTLTHSHLKPNHCPLPPPTRTTHPKNTPVRRRSCDAMPLQGRQTPPPRQQSSRRWPLVRGSTSLQRAGGAPLIPPGTRPWPGMLAAVMAGMGRGPPLPCARNMKVLHNLKKAANLPVSLPDGSSPCATYHPLDGNPEPPPTHPPTLPTLFSTSVGCGPTNSRA